MAGSEDYGYGGLYERASRALGAARDWWSAPRPPSRLEQIRMGSQVPSRGDVNLPVENVAPEPWSIPTPEKIGQAIGGKLRQTGQNIVKNVKKEADYLRGEFKDIQDIGEVGEATPQDITRHAVGQVVGILGERAKSKYESFSPVTKDKLGKLSGVIGASSESVGRAGGAAIDAMRDTGSEKKPLTDVLWEGAKGLESGYEKGAFGATDLGQEVLKRTGSTGSKILDTQIQLGLGSADLMGALPGKAVMTGMGAILGAGHDVGAMAGYLHPSQWKRARGVEGFTHSLNSPSDEAAVLNTGFGVTSSGDVLGRMGHASYYTPKEAKQARSAGKPPTGQSNTQFLGGTPMPIDFPETTKILDVRGAPVPKEDFDVIIASLDPVEDKDYIKTLTKAFNDQRHYAEGPSAVTHAAVRSGQATPEQLGKYYQKLKLDPVATDAIDRLNVLLSYPQEIGPHVKVKGSRGQALSSTGEKRYGSSALNQPGMTGEFGGIHYTDYVVGSPHSKSGSMAFDPRQTFFAPVGSQGTAITPWQQGKLAPAGTPKGGYGGGTFKGVFPSDAPGGVSAPTPGNVAGPAVVQPAPVPPPSQVGAAEDWAAQNMPPAVKKPPKSWEGAPTYNGKVISITEQGTLKELEAAGRDLTKVEQRKLAAVKQWESGRPAEVPPGHPGSSSAFDDAPMDFTDTMANIANDPGSSPEDIKSTWNNLLGSEKMKFIEKYPDEYTKLQPTLFGVDQPAQSHWSTFGTSPDDLPSAANFADKLKEGGTYDEIIDAYGKLSLGGQEDLQDFYTDAHDLVYTMISQKQGAPGFTPDAAALNRPATMEQHWNDVENIFEEVGFNGEAFKNWHKGNPDLTPEQLHLAAIEELGAASHYEAAEDLQKLWDMKVKGDTVDSPPTGTPTGADWKMEEPFPTGQIDVFDPGSGDTLGTFNTQAEADAFIKKHPNRTWLDSAPHDPSYAPENKLPDLDAVAAPVDYDAQYKGFVDLFHDTNADPEDVMMAWKDLHPALKSKLAYEDADLFQTISKMEAASAGQFQDLDIEGMDFDSLIGGATRPAPIAAKPKLVKKPGPVKAPTENQWTPEELAAFEAIDTPAVPPPVESPIKPMGWEAPGKGAKKLAKTAGSDAAWLQKSVKQLREMQAQGMKLPPVALDKIAAADAKKLGKVAPPVALDPLGKESIKSLDTHGSLDYLKNTYPEIAAEFGKHSGTEMGSIESHTKDVLKQWETQLAPQEFEDISNRYGTDVEGLMNLVLPLHDIGKPQAIASGDKTLQHSFTTPIIQEILEKEGFGPKEINLATELFNHDMIGSLLQGTSKLTPQQVADKLVEKANKIGMDPSDFAKLQLAFFQADASSYPFVTQYMKQQPNGGWISGSPKVKPIEDLIQGPTNIKSAAPTGADTGYQIKVKDAEDILGGTKNKDIYTKNGQDYLFKEANPAYFADQEVAANKVANLAGLHPIKIEVTQMGGKTGTMQAAVGNNMNWPTLKEVDPKTLTAEELRDVIRNHPVDWLTGNMDAHGAQFLRTPNGIVGIDRGRAFKNYASNKLHPDYNPTGGVGYYDQIYNDIVKLYKKGELPQLTDGDIESAIKQTTFKMYQNTNAISAEIADGLERSGQGHLKGLAKQRFMDLEKDLLKFWTGK